MSNNSNLPPFDRALFLLQTQQKVSSPTHKSRRESIAPPGSATRFGDQVSEIRQEPNESEAESLHLRVPGIRFPIPLKPINEAQNEESVTEVLSMEENQDLLEYSTDLKRKQKQCLHISRIVAISVIALFSVGFSLMLYFQKERLRTFSQYDVIMEVLDNAIWLGMVFAALSSVYIMMLHLKRCFILSAISSLGIAAILLLAALFFPSLVRGFYMQLVPLLIVIIIILASSWLLSWSVVSIQHRLTPSIGIASSSLCSIIACLILGILSITVPLLLISFTSSEKVTSDSEFMSMVLHFAGVPTSVILGLAVWLTITMLFYKYPHSFTTTSPHTPCLKVSEFVLQLLLACFTTGFVLFVLITQEQLLLTGQPKQKLTLYGLGVGLPAAMILGTKMIQTEGSYKIKFLLFPLCAFFPLILLSNYLLNSISEIYSTFLEFTLILIPIFGILWATFFCIFHRSRTLCLGLLLLTFSGFLVPLIFISPFYECGVTEYRSSSIIILVCTALALLILLSYEVYQFCRRAQKRKLCSLQQSYTYLGHWSNASGFILGESLLLYVAFNRDIYSHSLRFAFVSGIQLQIVGTIFSLACFFIITNVVLSLKTHKPKGDQQSTFFDYVFGRAFQKKSEYDQVRIKLEIQTERKFELAIILLLIVILPTLFVISSISLPIDGTVSLAFIFCAFFSLICGALGVFAAELKRKLGPYSKNGLPMCLTMIWSFIVLPFGSLIPATTVLTQDMQGSEATLLTLSLLILVFLLVFGTSLLSVMLNQVFKRLEYEHKAKLAVTRLYQSLKTIGVKGEPVPLRVCVDYYIWNGKDPLSDRLHAQNLVKCWELPPEDPDISVSKVLLTTELHAKVVKRSNEQKKKADYRELKLEQKFKKAVENKKIEKKLELMRMKKREEQAKRRAQKLEKLQAKQAKIKQKLGISLETSEINMNITKEEEDEKEERQIKQQQFYLSVKPHSSNDNSISPRFPESTYSNLVSRAEQDTMEPAEDQEDENQKRSQNYKIVSSKTSTQQQRLIALFDLISQRSSKHTVEQLLWISENAQDRLRKELYAYFSRDGKILERGDLETLFDICEVNETKIDFFLSQGDHKIEYKQFDRIIRRLGKMEYPAYSQNISQSQFLIGIIYKRMAYYEREFAAQGFSLYLLEAVRQEVERLKEARIKAKLQENGAQEESGQEITRMHKCKKCLLCPKYTLQWLMVKLSLSCLVGFRSNHKELDSKEYSEEITEEQLERMRPSVKKNKQNYDHKPSPEWDQISKHILQQTQASLDLYNPKKGIKWRCITPNIVMLFVKLLEFVSFLSFMWSPDIPWNFTSSTTASLTAVNGDTPSSLSLYLYFYGFSLALAILYTLIVRPAATKARNGTLGMNRDGLPAKLCTRPFWFSKLVQFMSASFYTFILKNLLDAFSCNFSSSNQVVLLKEPRIECFGVAHFALMGGALVGILAYYPFATFLYANLQFMNKDTDLKYNPQFLVYLAQAKLIFSSLASFLHSSNTTLIIRITLMAATALFLGIKSAYSQPCLVKSANIFHTAGYISISHLILMTALIVFSVNNYIVIGLMGGGLCVIWVFTAIWSCACQKTRSQVQI